MWRGKNFTAMGSAYAAPLPRRDSLRLSFRSLSGRFPQLVDSRSRI